MRRLLFAGFAPLLAAVAVAQPPQPPRTTPNTLPPVQSTPLHAPTPGQTAEPGLLPPPLAPEVKLPQKETLARIDPNGMSVRRVNDRWAVVHGLTTVREFGASRDDADEFVKVLRDLRPTDWGTVGTSRVVVEYGLTNGSAQQPAFTPKTAVAIDPVSLRIETVRGVWVVRDDANILLNFGLVKEDAEQAVGVIRKYGFNRVGQVGPAVGGVAFLFAQPEDIRGKPRPALTGPYAELVRALEEQQLTRTGIELPSSRGMAAVRPLAPATAPAPSVVAANSATETVGERIPIDPTAVELKRDKGDWKLMHGQDVLANFGPSEWSGRDALKVVRDLRFTEFCRFNAEVTYFLVNGQPPGKVPFAVQAVRFDRDGLAVKAASGGRYGVYEGGGRQLFACDTEKEARQLVTLFQEYGFDTTCQIGLGAKSSLRFLAKTGR